MFRGFNNYNKRQKIITATILLFIVLLSLTISILENKGIITWKNIYNSVGVSDFSAESYDYDLSVHFIDVGKADSIYIKSKNKNILIDAGERDTYNKVEEYLHKNNVNTLDLVIATHPHTDHIGGMPDIINHFNINKILMPKISEEKIPTSRTYERLLTSLKNKNITPEAPIAGTNIELDDLKFTILAPIKDYDDINDYSIVTKLNYKSQSFLFMGDAGIASENDIIKHNFDISANVLKVGHHGSRTATSAEFLKKVNPKYSVICVNTDRYNLPNNKTVKRLTSSGTKIYRTDLDGTIIISTNGDNLNIITQKNNM